MDALGWVVAGVLGLLLTGIIIGARLYKPATVNVTQNQTQHAEGGSATAAQSRAGGLPPIGGLIFLAVIAAIGLAFVLNQNAQTQSMAQIAESAARPQPAPVIVYPTAQAPVVNVQPAPVVVQQPAAAATSPDVIGFIGGLLPVITSVVGVAVAVLAWRTLRKPQPSIDLRALPPLTGARIDRNTLSDDFFSTVIDERGHVKTARHIQSR